MDNYRATRNISNVEGLLGPPRAVQLAADARGRETRARRARGKDRQEEMKASLGLDLGTR